MTTATSPAQDDARQQIDCKTSIIEQILRTSPRIQRGIRVEREDGWVVQVTIRWATNRQWGKGRVTNRQQVLDRRDRIAELIPEKEWRVVEVWPSTLVRGLNGHSCFEIQGRWL